MQQVNEGLHDSFSKVYREEGYAYELPDGQAFHRKRSAGSKEADAIRP